MSRTVTSMALAVVVVVVEVEVLLGLVLPRPIQEADSAWRHAATHNGCQACAAGCTAVIAAAVWLPAKWSMPHFMGGAQRSPTGSEPELRLLLLLLLRLVLVLLLLLLHNETDASCQQD